MLIIWRGFGFLVPIITAGSFLGIFQLINYIRGDDEYTKWAFWPKALAAFVAAVIIWFLGRYLNTRPGKIVIEKDTGKEIVLRKTHHLFFLPFEYWAIIIVAFIIIGYFM